MAYLGTLPSSSSFTFQDPWNLPALPFLFLFFSSPPPNLLFLSSLVSHYRLCCSPISKHGLL